MSISIAEMFADQDLSADAQALLSTHEGCLVMIKELVAENTKLKAENQDLQLRAPKPVEYYDDIITKLQADNTKLKAFKSEVIDAMKYDDDLDDEDIISGIRGMEEDIVGECELKEQIARLRWFGGTMWGLMECCPLTGDDKKPFEYYLTDEVADEY